MTENSVFCPLTTGNQSVEPPIPLPLFLETYRVELENMPKTTSLQTQRSPLYLLQIIAPEQHSPHDTDQVANKRKQLAASRVNWILVTWYWIQMMVDLISNNGLKIRVNTPMVYRFSVGVHTAHYWVTQSLEYLSGLFHLFWINTYVWSPKHLHW